VLVFEGRPDPFLVAELFVDGLFADVRPGFDRHGDLEPRGRERPVELHPQAETDERRHGAVRYGGGEAHRDRVVVAVAVAASSRNIFGRKRQVHLLEAHDSQLLQRVGMFRILDRSDDIKDLFRGDLALVVVVVAAAAAAAVGNRGGLWRWWCVAS